MKTITQLLKQSGNKKEILLDIVFNKPLAWRIITFYFKEDIYISENELVNFFKHAGIKKKCKKNVIEFIIDNLEEFKVTNKDKLRPSLLLLERKFMDLQYIFKRTISPGTRYPSYFDVFMKAEKEDIEWIVSILLGEWSKATGVTKDMIDKTLQEVSNMEYENDAVVCVNMMNKHTNQIVSMDMIVSKDILNMMMKDKVHKEFDKILKETVGKLSTVKNVNKLLYS